MKRFLWGFLVIFLILISLNFISAGCPAGEGYLGNKEYNSCVRISQTCANCTFVNISSITLSTSNQTLLSKVQMTNFGNGEWTYDFCNTTKFGSYFITGVGDINGINTNYKSCFDIGQNLTTGESLIYFLFLLILFGILFMMFYFVVALPNRNEQDEDGNYTRIVKLKYLRILVIALMYPITIIILNLMNGLATQFATLSIFAGTIGFLFEILLRGAWVFTIIIIVWIIYKLVQDSNIYKHISKINKIRY